MPDDAAILRICDDLDQRPRGAARDLVAHLQCFDANGKPLFTSDQIQAILQKVGEIALQAAESGNDRVLNRMLGAQIKLATVNAKMRELDQTETEANDILARLRERQRAAGA